jgi:hypothetical protein
MEDGFSGVEEWSLRILLGPTDHLRCSGSCSGSLTTIDDGRTSNTTDLANLSQISVSLSPTQAEAPIFPNILNGPVPLVTLVNLTTMDREMQNAYSQQTSFEIEQQLGERSTLSVGYQNLRGLHLIVSMNQNVPTCVAAGGNSGCRPTPSYANNSRYSSMADSSYNALHVAFTQRPARWGITVSLTPIPSL